VHLRVITYYRFFIKSHISEKWYKVTAPTTVIAGLLQNNECKSSFPFDLVLTERPEPFFWIKYEEY
jgi:hypothetical protein